MPAIFAKYASELRLYTMDFSLLDEIVGGDTISTIVSVNAPGLTVGTTALSGKTVTVVLSGGTAGATYTVTAKITSWIGRRGGLERTCPVSSARRQAGAR